VTCIRIALAAGIGGMVVGWWQRIVDAINAGLPR
jgi:hypothetical protein